LLAARAQGCEDCVTKTTDLAVISVEEGAKITGGLLCFIPGRLGVLRPQSWSDVREHVELGVQSGKFFKSASISFSRRENYVHRSLSTAQEHIEHCPRSRIHVKTADVQ